MLKSEHASFLGYYEEIAYWRSIT